MTCSDTWSGARPNSSSPRWIRPPRAATRDEAVIEAFALGVRLVQDSPLYSRIAESEPELFGLFSRSHVFPIRQFADGIAHTLRRCGTEVPDHDLANIADILLRVALGIIVFPTDRLDTSDPAAVRDYAARYLVPIIRR